MKLQLHIFSFSHSRIHDFAFWRLARGRAAAQSDFSVELPVETVVAAFPSGSTRTRTYQAASLKKLAVPSPTGSLIWTSRRWMWKAILSHRVFSLNHMMSSWHRTFCMRRSGWTSRWSMCESFSALAEASSSLRTHLKAQLSVSYLAPYLDGGLMRTSSERTLR